MGIEGNPTPRGNQEHTHAPKPEEPIVRSAVESMKSAARGTTRPVPEIYEALAVPASQLHPGVAASLPPVSTLSTSLYRASRAAYPKIPQTAEEMTEIPEMFATKVWGLGCRTEIIWRFKNAAVKYWLYHFCQ